MPALQLQAWKKEVLPDCLLWVSIGANVAYTRNDTKGTAMYLHTNRNGGSGSVTFQQTAKFGVCIKQICFL